MFEQLVRAAVKELPPYSAAKAEEEVKREYGVKEVIRLGGNENQWGTSSKALRAIEKEISNSNFYPERTNLALRQALAERFKVSEDMVITLDGGTSVITLALQTFVDPNEEVIMAKQTWPVYRTVTKIMNAVPIEISLKDFVHDLDAIVKAVGPKTKAIVICNPNNPTGTLVRHSALAAFLARLPDSVLIIMDEVYLDFATGADLPDVPALIRAGKPMISIRTFSKLYGLAGVRVGFGIAPAEMIQYMNRAREAFPVSRPAAAAALGALEDEGFRKFVIAETIKGRNYLSEGLGKMGLQYIPSQGNFLFVNFEVDAQEVFKSLLKRGIIIRLMGGYGPTWARMTVGTEVQNKKLLDSLKEILAQRKQG